MLAILALSGCSGDEVAEVVVDEQSSDPPLLVCAPEDPGPVRESCIPEEKSLEYLEIWQAEFMARNGISKEYFGEHISSIQTWSNCWNSGISFYVVYRITIDWAIIDRFDKFLVWLNASSPAYQHHDIPRDQFLNLHQVRYVLDNRVADSSVGPVVPLETLAYGTCMDAVRAFQDSTESPEMLPTRIAYYVPGRLPREDGYPYFIGFGTIDYDANECISGHFNLVSGAFHVRPSQCWVE